MRVFILCTGRSGSKSFIKACSHISNFTSAHESLSKTLGDSRFEYPDNHIEADNRLSWFLGTLDKKFSNHAFYVHLIRDKESTVNSFTKRWNNQGSIIKSFAEGILMQGHKSLNHDQRNTIFESYYDTVNDNIKAFLKDKDKRLTINLENISNDFSIFYNAIGAKGSLENALDTFKKPTNTSSDSQPSFFNRVKNFIFS